MLFSDRKSKPSSKKPTDTSEDKQRQRIQESINDTAKQAEDISEYLWPTPVDTAVSDEEIKTASDYKKPFMRLARL